jgi:hypothetical protein
MPASPFEGNAKHGGGIEIHLPDDLGQHDKNSLLRDA